MKTFISTFLALLWITSTAQENNYSPARWMLNGAVSASDNYTFYKVGASTVFNDHHSLGLAAAVAPDFWDRRRYYPGASAGYSYYFRKLGKYVFNAFVSGEADYYRVKRSSWGNAVSANNLYFHAGAGISFRYLRNITTGISVNYIVLASYSSKSSWTDPNGNELTRKFSSTNVGRTHSPIGVSLKFGYLFR